MIIEKARELGIELSESPEFKRMMAAQSAMEGKPEIMEMLEGYNSRQSEIMEEMSGEGDAKRMTALSAEMDELKEGLFNTAEFVEMMEARNAFEELMKRVNRAIGMSIGLEPEDDDEGCTHDCGSCHGCVH